MAKALALFSGGLDSLLAVKIIQSQGIEVEGVVFTSPFFNEREAEKGAKQLGIKLYKIDITEKILKIIENPKYGFGKNLNPCIDCHALMLKEAKKLAEKIGADFIITGEVVGERPKSQNYKALKIIEKEAGLEGKILRPLSAKKLEPTEMEKQGLIDREKLYDIAGRRREKQFELAHKYGISSYPSPAGGCLLTQPEFSIRLKHTLKLKKLSYNDLLLLKIGRHFITPDNKKIIVSRNEAESKNIIKITPDEYFIFEIDGIPGPVTIFCDSEISEENILKSGLLTLRYSKARNMQNVKINYWQKKKPDKKKYIIVSGPVDIERLGLNHI